MRTLLAVTASMLIACGSGELHVDAPAYLDHDMGEITAGLTAGEAGGCNSDIVRGLSNQLVEELNCISPNLLVNAGGPHLRHGASVLPFLAPAASDALKRATTAANDFITINDAYRTVAQQYVVYRWWQQGRCGIPLAAEPGASNHQSGRALDLSAYTYWRPRLTPYGFTWYGNSDVYHFDHFGSPALGGRSVLAFQRLWNKNNAAKLAEDGIWGPASASAMSRTPTTGFPIHGCAPAVPTTGTLKGVVYAANPANAADRSQPVAKATITAAGKSATTDAMGVYSLVLPTGAQSVTITAEGFVTATLSRQITGGQTLVGDFALTRVGGTDTTAPDLVVTSPEMAASVDAAKITVTGTASDGMGTVKTLTLVHDGGEKQAVVLVQGAFAHQLTLKPGLNDLVLEATDAAGNVATARVGVIFHSGVEGEVTATDDLATPLRGVTLTLVDGSGAVVATAASDAKGHFDLDFTQVPLEGQLTAELAGYQTVKQAIVVTAEARSVIGFTMPKGSGIAGVDPSTEQQTASSGGCAVAPGFGFGLVALVSMLRRRRRA